MIPVLKIGTTKPESYENSVSDWREYDQLVIEIKPKRLLLYRLENYPDSYYELLNISKRTAHRIYDLKSQKEDYFAL